MLLSMISLVAPPPAEPYRWKSVQMVGAGFVDGIVFHPKARNVRYARTDMGGAYRWDGGERRWMPMLDWVGYEDLNLMGVESIAVDANDPQKVYLACGTYTNPTTPNGAVLRSSDGGRTFLRADVPFKFGGNENGRGNGERMSVDPRDGRTLMIGTRHAGLWRSDDGAASWRKVEKFPWASKLDGRQSAGIIATLFDIKIPNVIYVAVSEPKGTSLYRSFDEGNSWAAIPGGPTGLMPTHMVQAENRKLYLTYGSSPGPSAMTNGAVWRFDPEGDVWTDVTPDRPDAERKFGYVGVSVQKSKPDTVIVSSFYRPEGEQIFRTLDGGTTWKPILGGKETYDYSIAPYVARTGIHWLFDIEIDPFDPNHAIFTTGYGGHETFNLTDADKGKPVRWSVMSRGIEESVPLSLVSPREGADLLSGIGDYGGFVHWNLDESPTTGNYVNPHFGNTDSVAVAENASNVVVRVGRATGYDERVNIGYSTDSGRTWKPARPPQEKASNGHIAVSPDGKTWIWSLRDVSYITRDSAQTWTEVKGLPKGVRAVTDRVNPLRVYALDLFGDNLYLSDDGGETFWARELTIEGETPQRENRGDGRGGQDQLYTTPGREGDLWIAAFDGLHHSSNRGRDWEKRPKVTEIHAFGFGKEAPGKPDPALYLVGIVDGQRGFFRSTDFGLTWVRINDDAHQYGLVFHITGDPKRYGRVYVGTHGRGALYGDPGR
ncbi:exo-alpha-sialidase [bacterium]|nr:MAG: exo-alpha-sialidase [bacterium]